MSELMFTGWQVVGCAVMCLAAGIGIGAVTGIAAMNGRAQDQEAGNFSLEVGRGQNNEKE